MSSLPISCFIIARDEEARLPRTIASVREWVDEVIVIEYGSSDQTITVAQQAGARVVSNPWQGYGPQKRFGEEQCRNPWMLNLDADEVVSPALKAEIQALFTPHLPLGPSPCGYYIRVATVYPGKQCPRLWADHYKLIRLYHRDVGRYADHPTHDRVIYHGPPAPLLSNVIWHYSFTSMGQVVAKYNSYTDLQAQTGTKLPTAVLVLRLFFEFPIAFFKIYFLKRHFTGGLHGVMYTTLFAFRYWLKIAKLLELKLNQKNHNPPQNPQSPR